MKELISQRLKEIWREQGLNPDSYSHAVGQAMAVYAEEYASSLQSKGKTKEEVLPGGDEINQAADEYGFRVPYDGSDKFYDEEAIKHFLAGVRFVESYVEAAMEEYAQSHANKDGWQDSDTVDFAIWAAAQLVNRNKLINPRLLQEFKDKYKPLPPKPQI